MMGRRSPTTTIQYDKWMGLSTARKANLLRTYDWISVVDRRGRTMFGCGSGEPQFDYPALWKKAAKEYRRERNQLARTLAHVLKERGV